MALGLADAVIAVSQGWARIMLRNPLRVLLLINLECDKTGQMNPHLPMIGVLVWNYLGLNMAHRSHIQGLEGPIYTSAGYISLPL